MASLPLRTTATLIRDIKIGRQHISTLSNVGHIKGKMHKKCHRFTKIRQMLSDNTELRLGIEELRKKTENNTKNIEVVFQYLDELLDKKSNPEPRTQIGYKLPFYFRF